ncbi:hypothetical protein ACQEVB_36315 [Pseudonocardia sp. CA-107938]|uniref:hypothetical protein n=1 Tax=Pseudonocardia sp. CA-107938 TaxID=3240021 RepID=UPI003D94EE87
MPGLEGEGRGHARVGEPLDVAFAVVAQRVVLGVAVAVSTGRRGTGLVALAIITTKILALVDAAAPPAPADMGEILTVVQRAST